MELLEWGWRSVFLGGFFWILWQYYNRFGEERSNIFWYAFLFRLASALAGSALFIYYYKVGDLLIYQRESVWLLSHWLHDPTHFIKEAFFNQFCVDAHGALSYIEQPRAMLMAKLIAPIQLLSWSNVWVTSVYLAGLVHVVSWYFVMQLKRSFNMSMTSLGLAFLFFPSFVFWTSGLFKESMTMIFLLPMLTAFLKIMEGRFIRWGQLTILIVCGMYVWWLKYYVAAVVFPFLIFIFLFIKTNKRKGKIYWRLGTMVIVIMTGFLVSTLHPNLQLDRVLEVIVSNYHIFIKKSSPGDTVILMNIAPKATSFIYYVPKALFAALFRPGIWESGFDIKLLQGFENLLILLTTGVACASLFYQRGWRNVNIYVVSIILVSCILGFFLVVSSPNFGTYTRYRVVFMPFYLLFVIEEARRLWFQLKG